MSFNTLDMNVQSLIRMAVEGACQFVSDMCLDLDGSEVRNAVNLKSVADTARDLVTAALNPDGEEGFVLPAAICAAIDEFVDSRVRLTIR